MRLPHRPPRPLTTAIDVRVPAATATDRPIDIRGHVTFNPGETLPPWAIAVLDPAVVALATTPPKPPLPATRLTPQGEEIQSVFADDPRHRNTPAGDLLDSSQTRFGQGFGR